MAVRLPNFLIAGVPKSGTSSMHSYLRGHPDIYLPDRKELHYFTHDLLARNLAGTNDRRTWERTVKTLDEYRSYYSSVGSQKIVGESSPSYAYFHGIIPNLIDTLGEDLRVLIMIRNPIRRAHSNYVHMRVYERETLSFHDAIMIESERKRQGYGDFWRYAEHGLYAAPIQAYRHAFGEDRVKVIVLEEFNADKEGVLTDLFSWLEIDPGYRPGDLGAAYGHTGTAKNAGLKTILSGISRIAVRAKSVIPRAVYHRMKGVSAKLNRANTSRADFPIEDRTWDYLAEYFREDLKRTSELIDRDLSTWLQRPAGGGKA